MRKEKLFLLILLISISTLIFAQDFEGFETGDFSSYEWQLSGDTNWLVTTSDPYEGTYCAENGDINDSEVSTLEVTREVTDNGTISFYWKVDSESGWDYLRFYLDGAQIHEISGSVAWTQITVNVTSGSHTFKWEYTKDGSFSSGADTGWIDNIIFPPSVTYDNDLAGMSVSGNQSVNVNSTEIYEVFVKNNGNNSQDEYTVKLFKFGGEELASLDVTDTIVPDQTVAHELGWVIPSNEPIGPTTIYGQVILAGDENNNNDLTPDLDIMVYPEGLVIILDEGFEGGSLPAGWSQDFITGTIDWIYENGGQSGNPAAAHTGSFNAKLYNTSSTEADITKLITPEINLGTANDGVLTFWHAQTLWLSDQDELHIYYKNSLGGTWTLIESFIADTPTWTERTIFLPNPSTTYYVAFEGIAQYGYGVCVDDVLITGNPTVYDNDLAGMNISGNTVINAGNTETYSIEVKNVGINAQTNYTVKLFQEGGIEVASLDVNQIIDPSQSVSHDLVWDVPVSQPVGFTYLYGQVSLAGDENPANDSTNNLEIQVYPQGIMEISVGDGTETNNRTPLSFQYKNSLTEIIYFADELAGGIGMITELTYYNNFTSNLTDKPTAVWLGETTQNNLTGGWIPSTMLTEVFNGNVTYPSGTNEVTIQFTTPYVYNGGNLVVMTFRPMDTQNYGSSDYFLHDQTPDYVDRTRYQRDDTMILDPASPPDSSYTFDKFANTIFTFFLGAMGEVEGYVYDDEDNPLEGASVTIDETQTMTYTNDQGYYHFGNVIAGVHDFTANLMGYSPQTITEEVIEDETVQVDFNLISLGAVSVSGHVAGSDFPVVGLENALVEITGFENYQVYTDVNGDFIIEDVYTNITYDILITYEGYDNYIDEISVGGTALDLGTIVLNEVAYPPQNVQATQNPEGTEVALSWTPPAVGSGEFRYDDGDYEFQLGYNTTPPNAVFGAVHSNIAIVQEIHWYLDSTYGIHDQVKLYLFGLDDEYKPDEGDVLYESGYVDNTDDEWNIHYLDVPLEAYEGFFVGVSTPNAYTSIGMDDGIEEPWEFQPGTQFCKENWTVSGVWTDVSSFGVNYERNFMIRAFGMNMGNTSAERLDNKILSSHTEKTISRSMESYNVYRFTELQHNDPSSWENIAEGITDTVYTDTEWIDLPNDIYQFAVRSVYTNSVESIPSFSFLITKYSGSSVDDLTIYETKLKGNYPNPFNPETTITFTLNTDQPLNVKLLIYNVKGQKLNTLVNEHLETGEHSVIWNGTDQNNKQVSSGVYFYQLEVDDKAIGTKRMLLIK